MSEQHYLHHDPAVRELIRAAQEKAWEQGYVRAEREAGWVDAGFPRTLNPYRSAS